MQRIAKLGGSLIFVALLLWFVAFKVDGYLQAIAANEVKRNVLLTQFQSDMHEFLEEQLFNARQQCDTEWAQLAELKLHTQILTALLPKRERERLEDTPRLE